MEITTDNLIKKYGGKAVVKGISINVRQGEVVGLLGPNGAGKTTTFYMIVGLTRPTSGTVMFDSEDVTRLPMYRRARAGISYLPQENSVFRNLTVEENIELVLEMNGHSTAERKSRTDELLERMNLADKRTRMGKLLSGGERRRVEIARALASNPKFILLDEPFTGVDPRAIEDIESIIYELSRSEAKIGILITDHNVEAMIRITDRAYIVADGEKRYEGPSKGLLDNEIAKAVYLGDHYGEIRDFAREAAEEELRQAAREDGDILPESATVLPNILVGPNPSGITADIAAPDIVCARCHVNNTWDSRFCKACGHALGGGSDAAAR